MELTQAIHNRHSVRQFTDQPVALTDIQAILTDAQQAPSWVNSQPYYVHLLMGQPLETLRQEQARLDAVPTKGTPDVPLVPRRAWSARAQQNMATWSANLGDAAQLMGPAAARLYNAPAVLYLTLPAGYANWSLYDLGAFGESILLGAAARGLATMTAYQFVKYPELLRRYVGIPADQKIIIGIGLGYEDHAAAINTQIKTDRQPLDQILTVHD
ncbi:nitroreductase [Lactiplantibacillus modestisalitolerans]|uniref:Nitroreductase n=1 Tax=Lactiplantibacillus modestisalitolerans TaxID=1457219 RepID=A0ABV5WVF1_9LACO|nr:nitroreductase [Lactiplantibacillus modestisalitolerans]